MARIPNQVINEVRSNAKIEDVVGQFLHLERSGKNFFAHCPFHEDQTPSFCVSPEKQIFHCFSCGRGGNVFEFLMDLKGMSFPQAVNTVANHEGMNISKYTNHRSRPVNKAKLAILKINDKAAQLYHHILIDTKAGQPALDYLHKRGLTDKTISDYNLGFAPKIPVLNTLFTNQKPELMRKSGLFTENRKGELTDRFFERIMYPIRNRFGHTIAFSGRVLNKQASPAKYLNTPETPVFHKRNVLFNLDKIKMAVRKTHTVILFEGYMDVMSAYQSNVKNGIASMGTSLTTDQIKQIQRFARKVIVCYDGDTPGQKAINRAVKILAPSNLQVDVVQMPSGIDPDEYRQKYGEQNLYKYVHSAQETTTTFQLRYLKNGRNFNNQQDLLGYIQDALKVIARVNPVSQDVYLNGLVKEFNISKSDLQSQLAKYTKYYHKMSANKPARQTTYSNNQPARQAPTVAPVNQIEVAEQVLMNRMLFNHNAWLFVTSVKGFKFIDVKYQTLYMIATAYFNQHQQYNPDDFAKFAQRANLGSLVQQINSLDLPLKSGNAELKDCINTIMNEAPISKQLQLKKRALNKAAQINDVKAEQRLTADIINLQRQAN